MVARPFVTKGSIDDNEIWRRSRIHDLPGGGEAYEQLTAACEQFFGDENCERCADDPSDNSYLLAGE